MRQFISSFILGVIILSATFSFVGLQLGSEVAHAQGSFLEGIAGDARSAVGGESPASREDGLVTCDGVSLRNGDGAVSCDFCRFVEMVGRVADFLVSVLIIIATIMLAVTGLQMALAAASGGGDPYELLKERMIHIVIGFVLIVASWVLVDTLLKSLVTDDLAQNWRTPIPELCGSQTPIRGYNWDAIARGVLGADPVLNFGGGLGSGPDDGFRGSDSALPTDVTIERGETNPGEAVSDTAPGTHSDDERSALADQVITNGDDAFGTTEIMVNGQCMEVMNDSPTLPDGTYVPFTQVEAARMASEWGWQIPTQAEALAIRRYAEQYGSVYQGITRNNTYDADRRGSITAMMNDPAMAARSLTGRTQLINGHFKWYVRDGGQMKIMGLSSDGRSNYHQGLSAAHSSQLGYVDYSHGVRLVRPCQ